MKNTVCLTQKCGPRILFEIALEAFEPVESSAEFIACDFTPAPQFSLSGEFSTPSGATVAVLGIDGRALRESGE